MTDDYVMVAQDADIVESALTRVEVDGKPVILTRANGQVCALNGICTHEFAELAEGDVEDDTIWCPLHASGFNVFSGEATNPPAVDPLDVYEVRIAAGAVMVSRRPRQPG